MHQPILRVESLSLELGAARILKNISFSIRPAESLVVLGANGAGKSSLLRCICGIYRSFEGKIFYSDLSQHQMTQKAVALKVAYVPQRLQVDPSSTVQQLLELSRFPHLSEFQRFGATDLELVESAMYQAGVSSLRNRYLGTLSGGELQRSLIAAALAQQTPILVLDEATSGLDPHFVDEIALLLNDLRTTGQKAILMASHDINSSLLMATSVLGLSKGEIKFLCNQNECFLENRLNDLYGKKFAVVEHPERKISMTLPG